MDNYVFGANILENLTTGMYQDSRVIYREYIQNACDQIDVACQTGLLSSQMAGEISIDINAETRKITIEDNATGIPADSFQKTLANIADSDKHVGEAKGFRGIGRLCGLAYCKEMVFASKYKGEACISIMKCDAERMRDMIDQNGRGMKHTAIDVLRQIYSFSTEPCDCIDEHWFRVELIDVNPVNHDLLDFQKIKDYLSFVAPVPYQNKFWYRKSVYDHAATLGQKLDEYTITLNGEQVFKKYGTRFKTSKGSDDIFDVEFKDFYDAKGNLIAWMWIGLSHFKAIIDKDCQMRGIRLRKENIQIGNEDALQKLFREDRGNHYFVGEVFAISQALIPNSQRDYFNENETRSAFEKCLRDYFNEALYRFYHEGSAINSAFSKIDALQQKEEEHRRKMMNGDYVDDAQMEEAAQAVEKAREDAQKAECALARKRAATAGSSDSVVGRIISRIDREREQTKTDNPDKEMTPPPPPENTAKSKHRSDRLSQYNRRERKLISRIFSIIISATDEKTAEQIISQIEDELQ